MNPRLYIHIGPPKTGSTALQIALERGSEDETWLYYAGVFNPRDKNRERNLVCPAHILHEHFVGRSGASDAVVVQMLCELRDHLSKGRSIIVSEEAFLLNGHRDQPFDEKLQRLANLLCDFPVTILLSLRAPDEALFSLYQHEFPWLPVSEKLSFARFCRGPYASCFDYPLVLDTLQASGFQDVRLLDHELLKTGVVPLRAVIPTAPPEILLTINRANESRKGSHQARVIPAMTLKAFINIGPVLALVDRMGLRSTRFYKFCVQILDQINLRRSGVRRLVIPSDIERKFNTGYVALRANLPEIRRTK